jgi:hypothetical protein
MTNAPTGSSILPINLECDSVSPQSTYFFPIREIKIFTKKLEDVFDELGEGCVDLIKLDIQGAELEVLKGLGERRIENLLGFEMEVGLGGVYRNQTTLDEAHRFAENSGFELFDLRVARGYTKKGDDPGFYQREMLNSYENVSTNAARVHEFDLVYFRKPKSLIKARNKEALRRLMVCYGTYNFFTEALKLAEDAGAAGVFSEQETKELVNSICTWHQKVWHRPFHRPTAFLNFVRKVMNKVGLGTRRWAQYLWMEYPNF